MKYFFTLFVALFICQSSFSQTNPDFYLAENGVTCMFPDADFGDSGTITINGVEKTFTKRSRNLLYAYIELDSQDPEIALTCTSCITDLSGAFDYKSNFNQDLSHWLCQM
jgi:predicted amidohydrolase